MAAKKTSAVEAVPAAATTGTTSTAKKAAPAKQATAPAKQTAKKAAEKPAGPAQQATPPAKKTATKSAPPARSAGKASAKTHRLEVREGERQWTAREMAEVQSTLESDAARLHEEISAAETEIGHLLREGGEGAGNDQADVGSNTFERDHEMSMAKNARANLELVQAALRRIDEGSYGICEGCGRPIGKMRLQAFPRATLCMECKQREERR